jgi:polysaccharide export outer membrane protein
MLKRSIAVSSLLLTCFLLACSSAPGNVIDRSRLKDNDATPTETYPVHLISATMVVEESQVLAHSKPLPPAIFADASQYVYRVAPQDILGVTIWDHPELTMQQSNGTSTSADTTQPYSATSPGQVDPYGQTVDEDGIIYFPFVGKVRVAGKTTDEIRDQLTAGLSSYLKNPQLDVRVLAYRSQKITVTGKVNSPGSLAVSDLPLTLVDAIIRSGGTTADADLQRVLLVRGGQLYELDANGVLDRGDTRQNVMLQAGDIITVPDRADTRVFVMGEVKTPMPVTMIKGRLTIADALTQAGGVLDTDANVRQIYVVRGSRTKPNAPDIYRLDLSQPDSLLLSTQFQLLPLDVVYVGTAGAVQFNRLVQHVLPTVESLYYARRLTR